MTPEPLLPRVARGEPGAVRECIDRYGSLVWSLARRLSATQADAEDSVQEIFLDVWKSSARYNLSVASEPVFIAMIARRRLIDRARSRKRSPITDPVSESRLQMPGAANTPQAETCVDVSLASEAVAQLRPEQRQVLLLGIGQGLSHEEIAETLSLPIGAVKTHARRALLHVRAWLTDSSGARKAAVP